METLGVFKKCLINTKKKENSSDDCIITVLTNKTYTSTGILFFSGIRPVTLLNLNPTTKIKGGNLINGVVTAILYIALETTLEVVKIEIDHTINSQEMKVTFVSKRVQQLICPILLLPIKLHLIV
ncbi:hypothetical protein ACJX0J_037267, partial [Zea mays]